MVKALIVRQAIRMADFALLALLGFVVYKGIVLIMGLDSPTLANQSGITANGPNLEVAMVGPRTEYDAIINSRMYGPAGEFGKPDESDIVETVVETTEETKLPLRLEGATATFNEPTDPNASAFINNAAAKTIEKDANYWVGDEIMDGVRLLEVYPRRVKIINNNQTEWLTMVVDTPQQSAAGSRGLVRQNVPAVTQIQPNENLQDAKMVNLPKDETYQEMMAMDYGETIRQLRPQMKYDENDNVIGITSDYFSQIPLAQKTGFMDGDVITEVNGTPIDSQESVPDILIQEQNATSVRIRFERDGRPMVRTIRLE